jgi:hypothetical protein
MSALRQERPFPCVSPNAIAAIRSLSASNAVAIGTSSSRRLTPSARSDWFRCIYNPGRARTHPAAEALVVCPCFAIVCPESVCD